MRDIPEGVINRNSLLAHWVSSSRQFSSDFFEIANEQGGRFRYLIGHGYNALASRDTEGRPTIGVYQVVPYVNWFISFGLLRTREYFRDIGDTRLEKPEIPDWSELQWTRDEMNGLYIVNPNCPERYEFAARLSNLMTVFMIYHEFGHLGGRHVELLHAVGLERALEEQDSAATEEIARIRRGMEIEADGFAMQQILQALGPDSPELEQRKEMAVLAAMLFMCLLSQQQQRFDPTRTTHPRASFRILWAKHQAENAQANAVSNDVAERILEEVKKIVFETGWGANAIWGFGAKRDLSEDDDFSASLAALVEARERYGIENSIGLKKFV